MFLTHELRRSLSRPYSLPLEASRAEFVRLTAGVLARRLAIALGLYDRLTSLAERHKSDKGVTVFPFHGYTRHYSKLLEPFRQRPINLLEIGLARRTERGHTGSDCPSVRMWLEYFPQASIAGFDIDDFSSVRLPRTRVFRGDQGNPGDLVRVAREYGSFHVIIDDGSHASYHQQVTIETLFPYLAPGGLFIIEDLAWQPADLERSLPRVPKTRDWLNDRSALDRRIAGVKDVLFFSSPLNRNKQGLAVIVKA